MFAYVHFIDDGVRRVVPVSSIKKFRLDSFQPEKTYKIKFEDDHYYKGFVLLTAETEEEINIKKNQKRYRVPSTKTAVHDSTCDETEEELQIQNEKSPVQDVRKEPIIKDYRNVTKCKNCEDYKKTITLLETRLETVENLNKTLQQEVITKFRDLELNFQNPNFQNNAIEAPRAAALSGEVRGAEVHVGRNIWLTRSIFDTIWRKGKDSLFIKEMAKALFGEETLASSSTLGCTQGGGNRPALDATVLLAIQDILKKRCHERGDSVEKTNAVISTIDRRINEKIQDLRRGPRRTKKRQVLAALPTEVNGEGNIADGEGAINADGEGAAEDGEIIFEAEVGINGELI